MIRLLEMRPEVILKFWNGLRPFQKTLVTPRDRMESFLSILTEFFPIEGGYLCTDQVVFEPDNTLELLNGRGVFLKGFWRFSLEAGGAEDVRLMLAAVLADWVDFLFISRPASFAIYADHDEYLTVYAATETEITRAAARLESAGYNFVDYVRPAEGPPYK